jgi:hypothetical protein
VTPEQAWFDVQKLVLAAILGFILGTGGNFIVYYAINRDRRLRRLERESKRYKFWKEFFEAQNALPEDARYSERDMNALPQNAGMSCPDPMRRSWITRSGRIPTREASRAE